MEEKQCRGTCVRVKAAWEGLCGGEGGLGGGLAGLVSEVTG